MSMDDEVIFKGKKLLVEYVLMPTKESADNDPAWHLEVELKPENCIVEIAEIRDEYENVLDHKSSEFNGLDEVIKQLYFSPGHK